MRGYPLGALVFAPFDSPPPGCVRANGAQLPLPTYQDFYNKVGTRYGGNGTTTVGTPDLRGMFLRVFDDGRGVDSGRTLGSFQDDAMRKIYGNLIIGAAVDSASGAFYSSWDNGGRESAVGNLAPRTAVMDSSRVTPTANEGRPKNVSIAAFIYAYHPRSI